MNDVNKFTDGKRRKLLASLFTELYLSAIITALGFVAGWYRTSGLELGVEIIMIAAVTARDKGVASIGIISHILIELRVARFIFAATSYMGMRGGLLAAIESADGVASNLGILGAYILALATMLCWSLLSTILTIVSRDFPEDKREFYNVKFIASALHVVAQAFAIIIDAYARDRTDFGMWESFTYFLGSSIILTCFVVWLFWYRARVVWLWILAPVTVIIQGLIIGYAVWQRGVQSAMAGILLEVYVVGIFIGCFIIDTKQSIEETQVPSVNIAIPPKKYFPNETKKNPSLFNSENIRMTKSNIYSARTNKL